MNFSINKLLLAYLNKESQIQNERFKYRNNVKERKGEKSPNPLFLLCFTFVCIKMYLTNFYK